MLKKINRFMFSLSTIWFILFILLGTFLVIIPLNLFLPEIQKKSNNGRQYNCPDFVRSSGWTDI